MIFWNNVIPYLGVLYLDFWKDPLTLKIPIVGSTINKTVLAVLLTDINQLSRRVAITRPDCTTAKVVINMGAQPIVCT